MKRVVWYFVFLVVAFFVPAEAQVLPSATWTKDSVTAKASPFTNQLRKTIVFLRVSYVKDDGSPWHIDGTGFFVFYPDERLGKDRSGKDRGFTYLVTNRHMAIPGAEEGHSYAVQLYSTRLNIKKAVMGEEASESKDLPLRLGPGISWHFPADPSVDLGVISVNPEQVSADYTAIAVSQIASKEMVDDQQIAPGDQVVFAGYFYQWPGDRRIQPIVRQGILAMMPDEPIKTTLREMGKMYLGDIHAFHGNSGSPIFVNVGGLRAGQLSVSSYILLGIVSGYYRESENNFSMPAATVLTGEVRDNSGVTTIVPSTELLALLDTPELKQAREATVEAFLKKK